MEYYLFIAKWGLVHSGLYSKEGAYEKLKQLRHEMPSGDIFLVKRSEI